MLLDGRQIWAGPRQHPVRLVAPPTAEAPGPCLRRGANISLEPARKGPCVHGLKTASLAAMVTHLPIRLCQSSAPPVLAFSSSCHAESSSTFAITTDSWRPSAPPWA